MTVDGAIIHQKDESNSNNNVSRPFAACFGYYLQPSDVVWTLSGRHMYKNLQQQPMNIFLGNLQDLTYVK